MIKLRPVSVAAAILAAVLMMPVVGNAVIADPLANVGVKDTDPDENFGDKVAMYVQSLNTVTTVSHAHSFLKFDLEVPSGFAVSSAELNIYVRSNTYDTNVSVFYVPDNNWTQDDITWNNAPSSSGSPLVTTFIPETLSGSGAYTVFDLLATGASLSDGLLSVMLQLETDPAQQRGTVAFCTTNDENTAWWPYLEYTLEAVPVPPSILLLSSGLLGLAILRRRRG